MDKFEILGFITAKVGSGRAQLDINDKSYHVLRVYIYAQTCARFITSFISVNPHSSLEM